MKMRLLAGVLSAAALLAGAPAEAAWQQAESEHFIIYSEGPTPALTLMAQRLEKLDRLQRFLFSAPNKRGAMKIRVFVLRNEQAVQNSMAFGGGGVLGYYNAVTRGPFAVVPQATGSGEIRPENVLYHELTHHFQLQYFPGTYPAWFVEGLAEFVGTAKIGDTDEVIVGDLPIGRYDMFRYDWIPAEKLVQAKGYGDVDNVYLLYSEGWLLTHYLLLGGNANGQLDTFLRKINDGVSYKDAAQQAFGNLNNLNNALNRYARQRTLTTRNIMLPGVADIKVAVSPVSPVESALMDSNLHLYSGVKADNAIKFAQQVRQIAARFPGDPYALRMRIEADLWAADWADAIDAIARWAAGAPTDPWPRFFQGTVDARQLAATKSTDAAAWQKARAPMEASYKALSSDPQATRWLYETYRDQGVVAPVRLQNALYRAHELVPQDDDLSYLVAYDFEQRGMIAEAIETISPLAYGSPEEHPKDKAKLERGREKYRGAGDLRRETPREMLVRLQEKQKGTAPEDVAKKTATS